MGLRPAGVEAQMEPEVLQRLLVVMRSSERSPGTRALYFLSCLVVADIGTRDGPLTLCVAQAGCGEAVLFRGGASF